MYVLNQSIIKLRRQNASANTKAVIRLACLIVVSSLHCLVSFSQCNQSYSWVNWSTFNGNKASGTLWNGRRDIQVDVIANYDINSTVKIFEINRFKNFVDFSSIPRNNLPRVNWSDGKDGVTVICFSEPVTNPVIVIATLGNPDKTVKLTFSLPYVPLFADKNSELIDDRSIRGTEGNAVLLFPGTVDCITVKTDDYEYFTDFTWGIHPDTFPLSVSAVAGGCGVSRYDAAGGFTYQWSGGKTPNSASNEFEQSGTYTVTAIDAKGCTAYATASVTVPIETAVRFETNPPLCAGSTLTLAPSLTTATGSATYQWSSGETTRSIAVSKPGSYEVTVQDGGCTKTASITLSAVKPPALPPDTKVCLSAGGNTLEAGVSESGMVYNWLATGQATESVTVAQPGRYPVRVTNPAGCTAVRTLDVLPPPKVSLGPARGICVGDNTALKPLIDPVAGYAYQWSTGAETPTIEVSQPGLYGLTITNGICTTSASVVLSALSLPDVLPDGTVCRGKTISAGSLTPNVTYLWTSGGETTASIPIRAEGVYPVRITNSEGCAVVRTITVSGICPAHILAPTAFTPNGDGLNDLFRPTVVQGDVVELVVYNRWGEPIFSQASDQAQWDGKQNGLTLSNGTYTYRLVYRTLQSEADQVHHGTVVLLN